MSPAAVPYELGQIRYLPLRYDSSRSEDSATELILTLFPDWASGDSQVEFTRFTDGITNTLLKVVNKRPGLSKQDLDRDAVLLRAYGSGTAILIDREREVNNHELLMHHDLAPELLARFENGMLYRFVPGTPCQAKDLKDPPVLHAVARRLAHWHATLPCLYYRPSQMNGSNGHRNGANGHRRSIDEKTIGKPSPNVWTTMQKWILALPTETDGERQRQILLQRELEEIVHSLSNRPGLGHNGLVFSHCDLLCANIIMHRPAKKGAELDVSFIDYEYGTPSPAAFDVANHFAEWAGYDCDYSAVPNVSQRRAFISEYIKTYIVMSGQDKMDEEAETRRLMEEVDLFRGVPGFYWGIWSLIQATISEIDFDYANYAELRLGEYWAYKAESDGSRKANGKEMPLREKTWAQRE